MGCKRDIIISTLTYRFRLVKCQLKSLRKCLKPSALIETLKTLPETLDSTYDRILSQIPQEYYNEARVVFALLICSPRPVSLAEAAEAAAVTLKTKSFDKQNRLREPRAILEVCSFFVTLSPFAPKLMSWEDSRVLSSHAGRELRFTHYSVQEYLVSKRALPAFQINGDNADDILAQVCLSYLLSINGHVPEVPATLKSLPFLQYASKHWHVHAKTSQWSGHPHINASVIQLFDQANEDNLRNLVLVCDPERSYREPFDHRTKFVSQLYYASLLGFVEVCQDLIIKEVNINAQGGKYDNTLTAASRRGHETVVRLLLERGADINAQDRVHGNALWGASNSGYEATLRLLLENGADVNGQGGDFGNA